MMKTALRLVQITGAVVLLAGMGQAQKITYSTFQAPGVYFTEAIGINNAGEIVGWCNPRNAPPTEGFLYSGGTVTTVVDPSANTGTTVPAAINPAGSIAGVYTNHRGQTQAFLDVNGVFSDIKAPGTVFGSEAAGINNLGQVVGMYYDVKGPGHGFFFDSVTKKFKTIDVANALYTWGTGINDSGLITLTSVDSNNVYHAWLYNGAFTNIDVPGYDGSGTAGINSQGEVTVSALKGGTYYGFVYKAGQYTAITPSGATSVLIRGINDAGEVVGNFTFGDGDQGSFVATLPQQ